MIRARKKSIALIVALVFMLSIMAPMAAFASGTSYKALSTPTVPDGETSDLGSVLISIDALEAGTHIAVFSLPSDFDYFEKNNEGPLTDVTDDSAATVTAAIYEVDDNEFKLEVNSDGLARDVEILVPFKNVYVEGDDGAIELVIDKVKGQLPSTELTIGYISDGDVTLRVVDDETFDSEGTVTIRVTESLAGALDDDADAIKLKLPRGFVWKEATDVTKALWGDVSDNEELQIDIDDEIIEIGFKDTSEAACFEFKLLIEVEDYGRAEFGEIVAKVSGSADVSPSELVVGTFGDYGVTVTAEDAEDVFAGFAEQEIADIEIEQNLNNSLIGGRSLFIELPKYAAWTTPYVADGVFESFEIVGSNDQLIRAKVRDNYEGDDDVTLEEAEIMVRADAPAGPLEVKIYGSAVGQEFTVTVAEVFAPISATADIVEVDLGLQKLAAGDIVITESKEGALKEDRDLYLWLPGAVEFAKLPTVTVDDESDLRIGDVSENGGLLVIEIDRESDEAPATITISDIEYTTYRSVPYGDIEVKIGNPDSVGSYVYDGDYYEVASDCATIDGEVLAEWPNSYVSATVVNATVITPAPSSKTVSFTVGDEGVAVVNGRTLVQVNLLCDVLGLQKSWDAATKTAYFVKDGKTVAFPMGENAIYVSGVKVPVDQGGMIINDFTYATLRGIQMAFGGELTWDNDTKTATFKF